MASKDSQDLFARPASGLVREIDTLRASFFNIYASVGYAPGMVLAIMSTFPLTLVAGVTFYAWGNLLAAGFMALFGVTFIVLASAMPRSGGDYVWTSRIMHPYLGYVEGWLFVIAATFGTMAFNCWAAALNFGANFASLSTNGSGPWVSLASTLTTTNSLLIVGIILFILTVFMVAFLSTRALHTLLTAVAIVSVICMFIPIVGTLGVSPAAFQTGLSSFGIDPNKVIQSASTAGWGGVQDFTWINFNLIIFWGLWNFLGFQLSTYFAGELKGKIARNATIAIFVGLAGALLANSLWPMYFYNLAGAQFVHAWGYLFWNAPSQAPLSQPPYPTLIASIANPSLAPLFFVSGLGILVGFNFIIMTAYLLIGTRVFFAMSMDRMLPSWVSDVSPRTHSPFKLTLLLIIGGFTFYVLYLYSTSPLTGAWFMNLAWFATWLFPGLNAILLPYRRPDLYESVSAVWRKKIGGLHRSTIIGIVWTVYLVAIYIAVIFYPLIQQVTTATALVSYAISSGILAVGAILVVVTGLYFAAFWYNRKKGIDLSLTFKSVPPD
jgi:APA family basic amino acid/polyamine antiporter